MIGFWLLFFSFVQACKCPASSPEDQLLRSRVAYVVKIVEKGTLNRTAFGPNIRYRGNVARIIKGPAAYNVVFEQVSSEGDTCGREFGEGEKYILLGNSPPRLYTGKCSWNPAATSENVERALGTVNSLTPSRKQLGPAPNRTPCIDAPTGVCTMW